MTTSVVGRGRLETDIDQENWFPEDDALLAAKARFEEIFGNDDFCAILVEADDVFTPGVLSKIRQLGRELLEKVSYADDVISLTDFEFTYGTWEGVQIIDLVPDPIPADAETLDRIKAMALSKPSIKNRIVSTDGTQTWIMLRMKPIPEDWEKDYAKNPDLAIGRIGNEIAGQDKYAILNPKTTGLPVINVEKRDFFAKETPMLIGFSLNTMIIILPSLLICAGIGDSIHFFRRYRREFIACGTYAGALESTLATVGSPITFNPDPDYWLCGDDPFGHEGLEPFRFSGGLCLFLGTAGGFLFFSCAACVNAFFFMENPSRVIGEKYRVLKPGGRLAISTFGKKPSLYGMIFKRPYGVTNVYTDDEMRSMLHQIIETWFTSYKGPGEIMANGWSNKAEAREIIEKTQIK
jgi:SAM-dependent methyltransferase